ncbi:MAG: DUF3750 domain-containing protein [Richelia sp.]|nr:DUF3750 domain-containing protein [Richelia sp.]CDN15112.1 FIG00564258: hypothetical protein [Richelia intracellularis]
MTTTVELRAAKLPSIIGYIAVHYWFVIIRDSKIQRWEIWQYAGRCQESWGHLHKNLMPYESGVGNGGSWIEKEWQGETADILAKIIEKSHKTYEHNFLYRYYPGPNSNTYVQWVLNKGNTNYLVSALGIGKDYTQKLGIQRYNQVVHFALLFFGGFKYIQGKEFELHIFGLTIGMKFKPLLWKLPFSFQKIAINE